MESYPVDFNDYPAIRVRRQAMRPTARAWVRHGGLLFLTFLTTTFGGIAFIYGDAIAPNIPEPGSWFGYLAYIPHFYFASIVVIGQAAVTHPYILGHGVAFSLSLLSILTAHEAGHYVACRIYGVDATLPFFLPAPPLLGPGTFGAFIKIVSPIPSRRALFDIGVAGPLAGFVVVVPVAIIGILTSQPAPAAALAEGGATLSDPLLIRVLAGILRVNIDQVALNPFWFAAWIGLLVTSLNLLPVGQLDGGHAVMAVFDGRVHRWLGRVAFVTMLTLAVLGWFLHGSPGGFLYTIILAIMLKVGHPRPPDMTPLDARRRVVALITLVVFALSFWPFPVMFR